MRQHTVSNGCNNTATNSNWCILVSPELEYRLTGVVDSIAFGAAGTQMEGLMFASGNNSQRPVIAGNSLPDPRFALPNPPPAGEGTNGAQGAAQTFYGYDANGHTYTDTIIQNFGAAVSWTTSTTANQWQGELQAGITTTLAFSIRNSEIASAVHTPGAAGAVIVAIESVGWVSGSVTQQLQIVGGTVIGTTTQGQTTTTLVRITEAGLKLLRLTGTGTSSIKVSLAGDLNRDGLVNGLDSAAWEQAFTHSSGPRARRSPTTHS